MKIVKLDDLDVLKISREFLLDGALLMHPTETCYGFAVDVFNEQALKKLWKLKGRDAKKPVSILVSDLAMAKRYGIFGKRACELAEKYWPGPLTIVVPRSSMLPDYLNEGEEFIGIRCSSDPFSSGMVSLFAGPLTTTSANVSGEPPLYEGDFSQFGDNVDLIDLFVDGGRISSSKPSTVVKVVGDRVEVLRQGELELS